MPLLASNILSDWRRELKARLRTAYPSAAFVDGRRTGVAREQTIAVFSDGYRRDGTRAVVANPVMVIRFWPARSELGADAYLDPTPLEQASIDLANFLEPLQASLDVDDLWYFLVDAITVDEDPDEWGVEVRLTGYARNVATLS